MHSSASSVIFLVSTGLLVWLGLLATFLEFRKGVTFALSSVGGSWFFGRCRRGLVVGAIGMLLVTTTVEEDTGVSVTIVLLRVGLIELYVPRMVFEPMIVDT